MAAIQNQYQFSSLKYPGSTLVCHVRRLIKTENDVIGGCIRSTLRRQFTLPLLDFLQKHRWFACFVLVLKKQMSEFVCGDGVAD